MAPRRYVLRYRPAGTKPAADVERIRRLGGVTVIDESAKMLLIECQDEPPAALAEILPDWVIAPEQTMSLPRPPRKGVEGGGG
ncbi:MAG TPA: hypothetical protein VGV63_00945 [Acidimicrobiales bacterium]|nr:hypothetical protein [Acidimicrobiales bacterium]